MRMNIPWIVLVRQVLATFMTLLAKTFMINLINKLTNLLE